MVGVPFLSEDKVKEEINNMLNRVTIMGRLAKDPTYRTTRSDIPVTNFSLAVERDYINHDTKERDVDYINVTAWRGLADWVMRYLKKGQMVVVDGRMESSSWTDPEGIKRLSVGVTADDIYFGGPKRSGAPTSVLDPQESMEHEAGDQDTTYPVEEEDPAMSGLREEDDDGVLGL